MQVQGEYLTSQIFYLYFYFLSSKAMACRKVRVTGPKWSACFQHVGLYMHCRHHVYIEHYLSGTRIQYFCMIHTHKLRCTIIVMIFMY